MIVFRTILTIGEAEQGCGHLWSADRYLRNTWQERYNEIGNPEVCDWQAHNIIEGLTIVLIGAFL